MTVESLCREESKLKALALLQQRLGEVVDHADEKEERQVGREEEKAQVFILVPRFTAYERSSFHLAVCGDSIAKISSGKTASKYHSIKIYL